VEWNRTEWNQWNKPFIPLFGYSMMKNKFCIPFITSQIEGNKIEAKWWYGVESIPSYSIIIFEIQTMEHWVHLFKLKNLEIFL
jgi:hypothetical protein